MSRCFSSIGVVITTAALAACAGKAAPGEAEDSRTGADATVIDAHTLQHSGGSVLNILPSHVAGMRIKQTDSCPEILMRGTRSIMNSNNPIVYVDGTRSGNTCILETLVPSEVQRIEVYPMGVTQRPGYRNNPNGLILVFMKTSD